MMSKRLQLLLLLSFCCGSTFAGLVSIVGPRTVQHGNKYLFYLSAVDYSGEELEISLTGNKDGEDLFNEKYELSYMHENITIDLSESKTIQDYTLTAKIASENFEQSVDIFTAAKRYSVFIQTDKPLYKPGDIVKFRILIIDSEMKPYKLAKIKVELIDSLENSVHNFEEEEEATLEKGVIVREFQIATEPILGKWKLSVVSSDEASNEEVITDHVFEIKEYVLPRFEVFADTKHDVTQNEGAVRLTVYGNYTFGEFVKGKATITANTYDTKFPEKIQHTTTKTVDVEFKKMVEFSIKNELKIVNEIRPYEVKFEVVFEEGLTGQKMTKNVDVRVYKTGEYFLELVTDKKQFKPGFPFKIKAIVRKFDGSLATDRYTAVKLKVNFFYKPPLCSIKVDNALKNYEFNEEKNLKSGMTDFLVQVAENTTAMQIIASYQDVKQSLNIPRHEARSREYLVIKSSTTSPKIDKEVKIDIEGNGDWEGLNAVIIGRTGIVNNKFLALSKKEIDNKKKSFKFTANQSMAPSVYVIVYYMQIFGEIVYDQIKINFDAILPNKLDLKLSSDIVKPGAKISIGCKTTENSFISLLGVDQSVTLLGSGNDIDKPRIASDMDAYNAHEKYPALKIKGNKENRYLEFGESNAFIITNALDGQKTCEIDPRLTPFDYSLDDSDNSGLDFVDGETEPADENRVRKNFPETWIFEDFEADDDGKYKYEAKVPDTITSFIVTGFAVHPEKGLAIAGQKKITVFQDFFLKLYLPYSVRLGEILKVDVTVFNYITRPARAVTVKVEIQNDGEFDFVDTKMVGNECVKTPSTDTKRSKTITVPSGNGASTFFLVKTLVTGVIKLKVKATTANRKDEVEKTMIVEHEGLTVSGNIAKLFKPTEGYDSFSFNLPLIAERLIPESITIEASVIGDMLGPALQNIQNLIRMPSGCSEQQFKSWIPNIAAIKYLKAVNKLTDDYLKNGERYLATGYQQLLGRRQSDGSYSLWGETGNASIWLTAYVAKLLAFAKEYVSINDRNILEALKYVSAKQQTDGSFPQNVREYYYIKSKTQEGVPLTAFCAIALLENDQDYKTQFKSVIDKALVYINSKATTLQDNFAIAIAAYAFALNEDESTDSFLDQLKTNAIYSDDKMFWYREAKSLNSNDSPSINVEIAAYAIMAFVEKGRVTEAVPIMNWLITQRNSAGGFFSTTDTVIGLQALAKIAAALHTPNTDIEVKLSYEKNRRKNFKLNQRNALDLQVEELEKDTRNVGINVNGVGLAYVQVSYRYNTILEETNERFSLTAVPTSTGNVLTLKICASFIPNADSSQSQMTLIEVYLPSGYVYDPQTSQMVKSAGVRRVETEKQKTVIILYFDNFTSTNVCLNVQAIRENIVTQLKDSVVKIYDYNNKNHRASAFYSLKGDKFCDS